MKSAFVSHFMPIPVKRETNGDFRVGLAIKSREKT
jgi:hypothetical protein